MTDSKNITIVMLLLSAVVLSVLLLASTQTTQAGNTSARFGDYIMSPGARAKSADNLYIIDVLQKRLNIYGADPNKKTLDIYDSIDLAKYFTQ